MLLAVSVVAAFCPAQGQALTLMTEDNNTLSGPRGQWGYNYRGLAWDGAGYIGASFLRATIANRPSFSWDAIDEFVDDANARDFTPYLTINWAPGSSGLPIPTVGQYETFCEQVAGRYVPRGVRHFSVMNEPNWFTWQTATGSTRYTTIPAATYGELFRACAARVRTVAANAGVVAKVYFGELAAGASGCNYLTNAMSSATPTVADGIAFHPYQWTTRPGDPTATCSGISSLGDWGDVVTTQFNAGKLRAPSGGKPPLAITEFGYCLAGSSCVDLNGDRVADPSTMSEDVRADWLGQAFAIAQRNSEVDLFSYYHLTDGHGRGWNTGIVTAETGAPSLSARKLREVTGTVDPIATISAASDVAPAGVTVNGTVDPKGARTTYHFEYGLTAAYGSSTAARTVTGGAGPTVVSADLTALTAARTYHVKLVVSNRAGSGESGDGTFTTKPLGTPTAVVNPNGNRDVFFRMSNGQLGQRHWDGRAWSAREWGYAGTVAGDPSAVVTRTGRIEVFFRAANGQLGRFWIDGPDYDLPYYDYAGAVTSDPSAAVTRSGRIEVFYRAANGQLTRYWFDDPYRDATWHDYAGNVVGDPSVVVTASGRLEVFYRLPNGQLRRYWFQDPEWDPTEHEYAGTLGGNPVATTTPGGRTEVFYRESNGQLRRFWFQDPYWDPTSHDLAGALAGDPAVATTASGRVETFYRTSDGRLRRLWFLDPEWDPTTFGAEWSVASDPAVVVAGDAVESYFSDAGGALWYYSIEGGTATSHHIG